MRKIFIFILFTVVLLVGCNKNFLDNQPDDMLDMDQVFGSRLYAERYLANVYSYVPDEGDADQVNLTAASDEAKFSWNGVPGYNINNGNWSPVSIPYHFWPKYYRGIRSASVFIARVDEVSDLSEQLKAQYKAEARFLRAYYYFLLMRQYGPVIILENPIPVDAAESEFQIERNSYDECVNYVVSELDNAINSLPQKITDLTQVGRIDRVVAKALKSRVLLYAASPLFNGNMQYVNFKNKSGKQLINTVFDIDKWKKSADAAKAVIDEMPAGLYKANDANGDFDPVASYRNIYFDRWNKEIIWARLSPGAYNWEKNGALPQVGGFANYGVTQQLVDAFFMANGKRPITGYNSDGTPIINPDAGYIESGSSTVDTKYTKNGVWNMYINREPRFYAMITFNGSLWLYHGPDGQENYYAEFFSTGKDGIFGGARGEDPTHTGYAIRKYNHPSSDVRNWRFFSNSAWTMFRLGEIYLNYAEALNEVDPSNPDILKYLNLIRERAGIPQYGNGINNLPIPSGQDEVRELIRAERRIELAFEMHRVFDTRRWKIAHLTDNGPMYGMNRSVGTSLADPSFYARTVFERRKFEFKHNFWPISQSDINNNRELVQNPGW
jgi:hypothetical protein